MYVCLKAVFVNVCDPVGTVTFLFLTETNNLVVCLYQKNPQTLKGAKILF